MVTKNLSLFMLSKINATLKSFKHSLFLTLSLVKNFTSKKTQFFETLLLDYICFRFQFRSFSFNKNGGGRQKMICDVDFCLKETECSSKTDVEQITCPNFDAGYDWKKGPELL